MRDNNTRRRFLAGAIASGMIGTAGCLQGGNQEQATQNTNTDGQASGTSDLQKVVHAGAKPGTNFIIQVMKNEGFAEKHGISIDERYFVSPPKVQKQLVYSKDIPTGYMGSIVANRMHSKGQTPQIAGPYMPYYMYVLTHPDSDITDPQDLSGKRVSWSSKAADAWLKFLVVLKESHGVQPKEIQFQKAAPPASLELLDQGELDAILQFEPLVTKGIEKYDFEVVFDPRKAWEAQTNLPMSTVDLAWQKSWYSENKSAAVSLGKTLRDARNWVYENRIKAIETYGKRTLKLTPAQVDLAKKRLQDTHGMKKNGPYWSEAFFESEHKIANLAHKIGLIDIEPTKDIFNKEAFNQITEK